jgi:hypothetical protein
MYLKNLFENFKKRAASFLLWFDFQRRWLFIIFVGSGFIIARLKPLSSVYFQFAGASSYFFDSLVYGTTNLSLLVVFALFNLYLSRGNTRFKYPVSFGLALSLSACVIAFTLARLRLSPFVSNLFLGVGTSIVASLIFFVIIEKKVQLLTGAVEVPKLDLEIFINEIKTSRGSTKFHIMDTWTELTSDRYYEKFLSAIMSSSSRNKIALEIIVANPYSRIVQQRAEDLKNEKLFSNYNSRPIMTRSGSYSKDDAIRTASALVNELSLIGIRRLYDLQERLQQCPNLQLDIKLFNTAISIIYYAWNENAFIGFLPPDEIADKSPVLESKLSSSFGNFANKYFQLVKANDRSISIINHMEIGVCFETSDLSDPRIRIKWINFGFYVCKEDKRIYISVPSDYEYFKLNEMVERGSSILLLIDEIFVSSFIDDQCNQLKITFESENVPCGCAVISRRLDKIDPKVTGTPEYRERIRVMELFKTRYGAQTQASKYFGTNATFYYASLLK